MNSAVKTLTALAFAGFTVTGAALAAGGGHDTPLWKDTSVWVSFGFLVVIGLFLMMGVPKSIAGALDGRAQKIADELDQARRMREEAQEILAQYQRRQREAESEAEAIIDQAKKDAQRIADEARDKINEQIARRAKAAEEKIARAEAQALSEVRSQTADLAIEMAEATIKSRLDQGAQSAVIEKAIDELRSKLH